MADRTLVPYFKVLKANGYKLQFDSRAGGDRCVQFTKQFEKDDRLVEVQLWGCGEHRATHLIHGNMNTYPTGFDTLGGLGMALHHEETRRDNRKLTGK